MKWTSVDNFARNFLNATVRSIAERREHCGLPHHRSRWSANQHRAAVRLPAVTCGHLWVRHYRGYHTHGAYGRQYDDGYVGDRSDVDFERHRRLCIHPGRITAGGFPDPNDPAIVRAALRPRPIRDLSLSKDRIDGQLS
jgi:hypothetical protein